jgi:hypothetical protein
MKTYKEYMYHDFQLILNMKINENAKVRLLTVLFGSSPYSWKVIGITKKALEEFKKTGFKYISKMGINRSHLKSRNDFYKEMMTMEFTSIEEWWSFYKNHDRTILATSTENITNELDDAIPIDEKDCFLNGLCSWRHGKKERELLRRLYDENIQSYEMDCNEPDEC